MDWGDADDKEREKFDLDAFRIHFDYLEKFEQWNRWNIDFFGRFFLHFESAFKDIAQAISN